MGYVLASECVCGYRSFEGGYMQKHGVPSAGGKSLCTSTSVGGWDECVKALGKAGKQMIGLPPARCAACEEGTALSGHLWANGRRNQA